MGGCENLYAQLYNQSKRKYELKQKIKQECIDAIEDVKDVKAYGKKLRRDLIDKDTSLHTTFDLLSAGGINIEYTPGGSYYKTHFTRKV